MSGEVAVADNPHWFFHPLNNFTLNRKWSLKKFRKKQVYYWLFWKRKKARERKTEEATMRWSLAECLTVSHRWMKVQRWRRSAKKILETHFSSPQICKRMCFKPSINAQTSLSSFSGHPSCFFGSNQFSCFDLCLTGMLLSTMKRKFMYILLRVLNIPNQIHFQICVYDCRNQNREWRF